MQPIQIDRAHFIREGYCVVPNVLTPAEIAHYAPIFERRLPPDKRPPGITDGSRNGRKTLIYEYTDTELANLVAHPRMIEAVEKLIGPHFLINCSPFPVITYKSPPGHERFELGYHVDWPSKKKAPRPDDERHLNGILHFSTVQPGGGGFMLYPQSHRLVLQGLKKPELRRRLLDQDFEKFPDLLDPLEMCVPAGSAVFFHAFLVHDRSENLLEEPRRVLFTHYKEFDNVEQRRTWAVGSRERFAPRHLEAMGSRVRALCGLQ